MQFFASPPGIRLAYGDAVADVLVGLQSGVPWLSTTHLIVMYRHRPASLETTCRAFFDPRNLRDRLLFFAGFASATQRWCIAAAAFRASLDRSPFTYDAWVGVEPDPAHREKE